MPTKRAHLVLPSDLLDEVDELVGARRRSAFLTEIIRDAVRRRRLLAALEGPEPVLRSEDYPELRGGAAAWVRKSRKRDQTREQSKAKRRSSRRG